MAFDAARSAAAWSITLCRGALTGPFGKDDSFGLAGGADESLPAGAGLFGVQSRKTCEYGVGRSLRWWRSAQVVVHGSPRLSSLGIVVRRSRSRRPAPVGIRQR